VVKSANPKECQPCVAVSNCTLNSVLVPAHLRGLHLGQALVTLAVHTAVRDMRFACVTAWCQPEKMPFYKSCGFVYGGAGVQVVNSDDP
jgi:predicted GNAT family N-acyltransferase